MVKKLFSFKSIFIALVLAILITGGVGYYYYANRSKVVSAILGDVKSTIADNYYDVEYQQKQWTAQEVTLPYQAVKGYQFKVAPQNDSTIWFTPSAKTSAPRIVTRYHFIKKHLASGWTEGSPSLQAPFSKMVLDIFKQQKFSRLDDNGVARLSRNKDTCLFNGQQLACFDTTSLKANAVFDAPFVQAYAAAHQGLATKDLQFGPAITKSQHNEGVLSMSRNPGYDIGEAVARHGGKATIALFYKKTGYSWKYVTEADDEFGFRCGPMQADPDARKALYGQVCLSATGQVRLDSTERALQ